MFNHPNYFTMKSYNINNNVYKALIVMMAMVGSGFAMGQQKNFVVNNNNPLKNLSFVRGESHPVFVDIDGDNDLDCFIGEYANGQLAKLYFLRNDGTNKNPVFKNVTGNANPLNDVLANTLSIPYFVDIDGDGDYDCFVSDGATGAIMYYENTGTKTSPVFEKRSAAFNPLSMVQFIASGVAQAAFVDVDGDGDYDCLVTDQDGTVSYFENTGNAKNPAFKHVTGSRNPFDILTSKTVYNISFQDWNKDGLTDLFVNTDYYQNTGTKYNPKFSANTTDAPAFQVKSDANHTYVPLCWVDLHNNGNVEVFQGTGSGAVTYQTLSAASNSAVSVSPASFSVFPNPSQGEFVLNISRPGTVSVTLRISDALGRIISTQAINNNTIKFGSDLKPGVYMVQVMQNNQSTYTQKVIKE
jgi:hypothetical protein